MPSLATVAACGILCVASFALGERQQRIDTQSADPTVPAAVVETLAQVRCAIYVAEDGSATWEDGDSARDECWFRVTGHHLFRNWRHLRD
jgi:hypothetical protein